MFSSLHGKQTLQQRSAAPEMVPRGARGSFDTGWCFFSVCKHVCMLTFCSSITLKCKNHHTYTYKTSAATQTLPPAPARHMLSPAFMSFAQTFDWSQQASRGCLFTSWQQVNISHKCLHVGNLGNAWEKSRQSTW